MPQKPCYDHLGNEYPSIAAMAKAYDMSAKLLSKRLCKGMDVKTALKDRTSLGKPNKEVQEQPFVDHEGTAFGSFDEMTEHWRQPKTLVQQRLWNDWSLERALTTPYMGPNAVTDHLGNEYPNKKAMCDAYGITPDILKTRLKFRWSLEKALTTPVEPASTVQYDHLGNRFESLEEMAKAYELPRHVVKNRLTRGWTLEETLTTPVGEPRDDRHVTDPFGQVFSMETSMINHYRLNRHAYDHRRNIGYSLPECLGIVPLLNRKLKNEQITDSICILQCIDNNAKFFLCSDNGHDVILSADQITDICLEDQKEKWLIRSA